MGGRLRAEARSSQDRAFGALVRASCELCEACGSSDVLLGTATTATARFFVVKNDDLANEFRQPPTWKAFGFIDAKSVEKYENNWEVLT
jgi:hypothetical protein